MPNFRALTVALMVGLWVAPAQAQAATPATGFAVERLYPSAPGGGWLVMDTLDTHGRLGGAMALTLGYSSVPLQVGGLDVVGHQANADFGFAITYRRWRWYLNMDIPLALYGQTGVAGGYSFTAPRINPGDNPDVISDVRLGTDVRLVGSWQGAFRLGLSAQLLVPSGHRADYDSDDQFRGMVRVLFAGDVGWFSYAAQLGAHIRTLDSRAPQSPAGSELLFGAAVGGKILLGAQRQWAVVLGPELFGASAFRALFSSSRTAFEGLASARIEGTRRDGLQIRCKLGIGGGIHPEFGAPEWRLVAGIEVFNHRE